MHLLIVLAAMAFVTVTPFLSVGPAQDELAALEEQPDSGPDGPAAETKRDA